jgi:hypothetical protein
MPVNSATGGRVARAHSGAMPYQGRWRSTRLSSPAIMKPREPEDGNRRDVYRASRPDQFVRQVASARQSAAWCG